MSTRPAALCPAGGFPTVPATPQEQADEALTSRADQSKTFPPDPPQFEAVEGGDPDLVRTLRKKEIALWALKGRVFSIWVRSYFNV